MISEDGSESHFPFPRVPARPCIFEYIYFSRPDSMVGGRSSIRCARTARRGARRRSPADADVVIPVPDSGVPAALGYAKASGIPELGIIRNPLCRANLHRADAADPGARRQAQANANRSVIKGRRIVLVDDSIVRGTYLGQDRADDV